MTDFSDRIDSLSPEKRELFELLLQEEGLNDVQFVEQAPQTPTEHMLAAIWAELLNIQQITPNDDFFALGGHSLLAAQIISRVREACQVELSVDTIFEAPILAELAKVIDAKLWTSQHSQTLLADRQNGREEGEL